MTTLSSFKSLIEKLKREELKSLLKFLRYYQESGDDTKGKSIQLVEAVISDPTCSVKDLQIELYGKENYNAFNKLLNRTKDKIYEVLLFDQNLSKPYYSERNRIVFDIRKKLVQSEILYLRGMNEDLEGFQNKIIHKALQYEIYDSLIEALQAKQRFLGFRFGKKAFDKVESDIVKYEQLRTAVRNARSSFLRIATKINQSISPLSYEDELNTAIINLRADFERNNSATIGYHLYLLETQRNHNNNQFEEAEEMLQKLQTLVLSHPSVYTRARHADVFLNLSTNEIFLKDYDSALKNIEVAKSLYDNNSTSLDVAKEIEFFIRYFNGELDIAEKIIRDVYNSSRTSNTPFLYSKRAYLYACICTIRGNINLSNELLLEIKEIEKDKEGWNLGKRILTIINKIEANDFESADLKVLSLEKFIKRILKFSHVRKRDVIILRVLIKLINENFDFEKVYQQRKKYFELLEGNEPEYAWKIKSPELIIFHDWFKKKMNLNSKTNIEKSPSTH
jgi:hypothetical protein